MVNVNELEKENVEANTDGTASTKKLPFAIRAVKKLIKWTIIIAICVVFYNFISGLQNEQKENFLMKSKSQAITSCNRDSDCISKVNNYFNDCIEDNYTSYKSGRYKRKYVLDLEGLNGCIASK